MIASIIHHPNTYADNLLRCNSVNKKNYLISIMDKCHTQKNALDIWDKSMFSFNKIRDKTTQIIFQYLNLSG